MLCFIATPRIISKWLPPQRVLNYKICLAKIVTQFMFNFGPGEAPGQVFVIIFVPVFFPFLASQAETKLFLLL